jgi:hypothetical protein
MVALLVTGAPSSKLRRRYDLEDNARKLPAANHGVGDAGVVSCDPWRRAATCFRSAVRVPAEPVF